MSSITKIVLSLIFLSNIVLADDSAFLSKGQAAPWDGILLSPDRAQLARQAEMENKGYKLLNDSLNKSLDLEKAISEDKDKKIDIISKQNDNLSTQLEKSRDTNQWEHILWFGLGVLATGLAVEGASKLR